RNRWRRFLKLQLPLIMPFLIAGLRIAYGIAWKVALVAELFGARSGLGWLLQQAQTRADAATVFAACLVIVVIFAAVDGFVLRPLARRYSQNLKEA
ncbi:MAG: ABC transporter permease subunit, partial [Pseudomonadota bacterium]